jgi:hypothetical protein
MPALTKRTKSLHVLLLCKESLPYLFYRHDLPMIAILAQIGRSVETSGIGALHVGVVLLA